MVSEFTEAEPLGAVADAYKPGIPLADLTDALPSLDDLRSMSDSCSRGPRARPFDSHPKTPQKWPKSTGMIVAGKPLVDSLRRDA